VTESKKEVQRDLRCNASKNEGELQKDVSDALATCRSDRWETSANKLNAVHLARASRV
jgi:ribosomal protein L18E